MAYCEECSHKDKRIRELEGLVKGMAESADKLLARHGKVVPIEEYARRSKRPGLVLERPPIQLKGMK